MIERSGFWFFLLLLVPIYSLGLLVPLMQNDSAQHAVMAMRMFKTGNYLELIRGYTDYLDKPHLHFWLSAISYKFFGINHIAYRLPSFLMTILGAFSVFRLSKHFYNTKTARVACLIFLSCVGITLGNVDTRTDIVLTGTVAFALWQLILFVDKNQWRNLFLGFFGLALAFMTKGLLGVLIVSVTLFWQIIHTKKWKLFLGIKFWLGILAFFTFSLPVFYAFHFQFGWEGVRFILWDQSFHRLKGEGFKASNPEYSFFFFALLWVFLPWSVLAYFGIFRNFKSWMKRTKPREISLAIGSITLLLIMGFAQYKLPHYLNGLLPSLSIVSAAYWANLTKRWEISFHRILMYILAFVAFVFICWQVYFVFSIEDKRITYALVFSFLLLVFLLLALKNKLRTFAGLFSTILFVSLFYNLHFYPTLTNFQEGITLSSIIERDKINPDNIWFYDKSESWTLCFYNQMLPKKFDLEKAADTQTSIYLFVDRQYAEKFDSSGIQYLKKHEVKDTRISMRVFDYTFLNPKTRHERLGNAYLVQLR